MGGQTVFAPARAAHTPICPQYLRGGRRDERKESPVTGPFQAATAPFHHHTAIRVRDIAAMLAFYRDTVGLPFIRQIGDDPAPRVVWLHAVQLIAADDPGDPRQGTLDHLAISVLNIRADRRAPGAAGAALEGPITQSDFPDPAPRQRLLPRPRGQPRRTGPVDPARRRRVSASSTSSDDRRAPARRAAAPRWEGRRGGSRWSRRPHASGRLPRPGAARNSAGALCLANAFFRDRPKRGLIIPAQVARF